MFIDRRVLICLYEINGVHNVFNSLCENDLILEIHTSFYYFLVISFKIRVISITESKI